MTAPVLRLPVPIPTAWLWLPVALPIAAGLALFRVRFGTLRARNAFLMAAVLVNTAVMGLLLLCPSAESHRLIHFTGSLDFAVRLDGPGRIFAGLIAVLWPLVTLYAFSYMEEDKASTRFFAVFTMTYGIALGVALAANLLTLYCFFEMLSLITVPLVMHDLTPAAVRAARKYLYFMLGGTAFAFIGLIFVIVYGDSCDFLPGGVFDPVTREYSGNLLRVVYLFTFFGFGAKAAVFPLHSWLPDASVAPTPVTALLHAVAVVNAGVFAILRVTYQSFGCELLEGSWVQTAVWAAALFTILWGSSMAVREMNLKRRLAYSTVANLSYMLLGVVLLTPAGLEAGMLHMVFHGVMKIALFCCAGAILVRTGKASIAQMDGLARAMPLTFACFTAASLSLVGLPPFAGFFSKWALIRAAFEAQPGWRSVLSAAVLLFSALLTAVYTLRFTVHAYAEPADRQSNRKPPDRQPPARPEARLDGDARLSAPIVLTAAGSLALGAAVRYVIQLIRYLTAGVF